MDNIYCPNNCKQILEKGNVKGYYSCDRCKVVWYIIIQSVYPECERKEVI